MATITINDLLQRMKERGRDVELQEETNQIYEVIDVAGREFPLFGRIMEEGALIQLLTFIPVSIEPEALPELARLLHLLNKELDVPGFGLDETAMVCFYRCMIPTVDGVLHDSVLDSYLKCIQTVCSTFGGAIEAVATGSLSFEGLLSKAEAEAKKMGDQ